MTGKKKGLCVCTSSYRSHKIQQKISRFFFYPLKSALDYPTEIGGKSLTDDKAVGNRISLVSQSTGFKGCSYQPGGEIQTYPISRDTVEGKGDGQANGRSMGRAQSHPCGRF